MNSDLIVFGEDWGGLPSSTQHLMRHLGSSRKILWINSIGLRKPRFKMTDCRRACNKLASSLFRRRSRPVTKAESNFTVFNPTTIPAPSNPLERHLAKMMLRRQLLPAIRKAGLQRPVLWLSLPTASDLVGQLGEKATVYYCGDDFSALAGVDHETVSLRERELEEKANLIITASERLAMRFPEAKTELLTHGVDFDLFSSPCARADDMPFNGRPTAGFYGSLSEWLDLELLGATIERMPHWDFVFIGKAEVDVSELEQHPNVRLLGPRSHCDLPRYSQHWNVSLLPFRNNAQIRACNPLKLNEYLAAGKPIVSTPMPALKPYRSMVSVVSSVDSMVAALEVNGSEVQAKATSAQLRSAVANQSWQAKAEMVNRWLESV